jgi:UDP-3-O-[3-hydroxymyristoyl] glucosamine N-acyltransferase
VAYRLAELAELVEGRVEGDPEHAVETIRILEEAGPGDLSFLTNPRYRAQAVASRAGALLVGSGLAAMADIAALGRDLLVVDDPGYALALLLARFHPDDSGGRRPPGVHPTAILEPGCKVDPTAHVGPYVAIGEGSRIGAGATLHAFVAVGRSCTVGEGAVLHPHAVLYDGTELGAAVIVHAGVVLGADGFGYAAHGGAHHKVPQLGRVVIEANVEIGANSTVDRATLGATRIGEGTKIDNLVQIGHNVQVGRHSILCGQAGIAGSARLGDGVVLAGQAGVAGHIQLGDRVQVAAKSAALASVVAGTAVAGIPAVELRKWRRQTVLISRLEEMNRRLRALERLLGEPGEADNSGEPGDSGEEG